MSKRSNQSRREFLENSMFATAAAVAAGSATQPFVREARGADSPNEKLRVAVVGVRGRGKSHIGGFAKRKESEVTVICDADTAIGEPAAKRLSQQTGTKVRYEKDVRKVVEDPNVDVVAIATPNHWHALMAIWAIQNGKDVYVEKPVSHNVSEGRRIVQAARKYDKICQTGTQVRSSKGVQEAVEFMKNGGIGDVKIARGLCYKRRGSIGGPGEFSPPESVDYDLWCGPAEKEMPLKRPRLHYDWHWDYNTGNGDLGNQGIHQMDIARWGLGVDDVGTSVLAYGGRFGYEDGGDTANTQISIHEFEDGKRVVFEVRGLETDALRGAKIGDIFYGTEGYVVISSYNGGAAFDPDGKTIKKFSGGGDHFGNFLNAVASRDPKDLNADIEQGHLSSALCHLGNISLLQGSTATKPEIEERLKQDPEAIATFERFSSHLADNGVDLAKTPAQFGRKLAIDPAKEEFVGSDVSAASAMLTRPYRKGFEVPSESNV